MKREIKELAQLANTVANICKEVKMELNKHNQLRATHENKHSQPLIVNADKEEITMYIGDNYDTWSFKIGTRIVNEIEIKGYSESISMPWSITAKKLKILTEDVSDFTNWLHSERPFLKAKYKSDNTSKIEKLKEEIKQLEA
jgi:hypothetical protein